MCNLFNIENFETSLSRTASFSIFHIEHRLSSNISLSHFQHPTLKHADCYPVPSLSAPPPLSLRSLSLSLSPSLITISLSLLCISSSFSDFLHLEGFSALFFTWILYNKEENSCQKKKGRRADCKNWNWDHFCPCYTLIFNSWYRKNQE